MPAQTEFILGEHPRTLDERYRLSVPQELIDQLMDEEGTSCVMAKERPGCLSLWKAADWQEKMETGVDLIKNKMRAGRLEDRVSQLQLFGRLLSTRHRTVHFSGRGRLVIPEGFREFLKVEPGNEVVVIGAAVCVELWQPEAWFQYLERRIPQFRKLFDRLSQ